MHVRMISPEGSVKDRKGAVRDGNQREEAEKRYGGTG